MSIAVVAYPTLNRADSEWIEAVRAAHDPQAQRIKAHFTLVFPVQMTADELDREIAVVAASTERVSVEMARAVVRADAVSGRHLVVLEPEAGRQDIVTVHNRLYAGVLERHLRRDLPFVPHMTIGAAPDRPTAESLAAVANARMGFRGELASLTLVDVDASVVRTVASYRLGIGPVCRGCR
jgi:2'-5' RNA ligase